MMQHGRDSAAAGGHGARGSMHERHMRTIALFERMMRDPAIRARVLADSAMHRMLMELEGETMRHHDAHANPGAPEKADPHAGHEP